MKSALFAVLLCLAAAHAAAAHAQAQAQSPPAKPADPHAGHAAQAQTPGQEPSAAQKYFSDVELLDHEGRKVRLYTDLLKGKTVVVNTFFSTCNTVCPVLSTNMRKIQEEFGDRVGKDLFLISITVDPTTDTPTRLKEYAQKFRARPGWLFVTGKKENVDWALYKLGQYVEKKDDHKTVFIIGNEATGLWKKAYGLAKVSDLSQIVESVLNDKGEAK